MVSDWFNLRTFLHSFHFIHVTMSLIIYAHLSLRHTEHYRYDRTSVTPKNPVYDPAHHESSTAQWLECPTGMGMTLSSWLNWPVTFYQSDQNITGWQTLFTWFWRWLLLRLSKCQLPTTTVLFRTTLTQTITLYEQQINTNNITIITNKTLFWSF